MEVTDLIQLVATVIAAVASTLTLVVTVWLYLKSKKEKIAIYSELEETDGKVKAKIRVRNANQKQVVIDSIRFPLTVWSSRKRLQVNGVMKILRFKDLVIGTGQEIDYVSQTALCGTGELPASLNEDEVLDVSIAIDDMMEEFFQHKETLGNKLFFGVFLLFFPIEICTTNGRIFRGRAHWEIRYYLWKKYKNDPRVYGDVLA